MPSSHVVIIGAGLSGLACALRLQDSGTPCTLLEASTAVGGRVRTDIEDGFHLDRGFQVLLTVYPQTRKILNYGDLRLSRFYSGALVRLNGRFARLADPTREPLDSVATVLEPALSLPDKLRILKLRHRVCGPSLEQMLEHPEVSTLERLTELGFSNSIIERFFKPFLGGIFLDDELVTSSRKFEFVFRMFSLGDAALPAAGIEALPRQMAARLASHVLRTNSRVTAIDDAGVHLELGETVLADRVVVATDQRESCRLLRCGTPGRTAAATCLYYAAPVSPVKGPWLVLNGDGVGPINNLCAPTELHSSYAPHGTSLISVTVIDQAYRGRPDLETQVRAQLATWYGSNVSRWRYLRTYEIDQALPLQQPPLLTPINKPVKLSERLYRCGDYLGIASIEGAIASGIRAAQAVLNS